MLKLRWIILLSNIWYFKFISWWFNKILLMVQQNTVDDNSFVWHSFFSEILSRTNKEWTMCICKQRLKKSWHVQWYLWPQSPICSLSQESISLGLAFCVTLSCYFHYHWEKNRSLLCLHESSSSIFSRKITIFTHFCFYVLHQ